MLALAVLFVWLLAAAGLGYHYRATSVVRGFVDLWRSVVAADDLLDQSQDEEGAYGVGAKAGVVSVILVLVVVIILFVVTVLAAL